MARPSRPSVRLTALDEPTMTKREEGDGQPAHVRDDRNLEERKIERASLNFDQRVRQENRTRRCTASASWKTSLSRPLIPSDFFFVTFK